jgi:PEP-CTERM motif-containing protein
MKKLLLTAALFALPLAAQAVVIPIPEGTVTLNQVGTNVTFNVLLTGGNRFVETAAGGGELFLFNDAIAGSTITTISAAPNTPANGISGFTNLTPVPTATAGSFTASVECTFATDCNGAGTPDMTSLSFTVTNATIAQLSTANAAGFAFFADTLAPVAAPEPATLAVLGVGLLGLVVVRRRIV